MRTTERFAVQRKKQLELVFNEPALINNWRKIVRKQMRSLDILDLHDYYDFNYRIDERAKNIVKSILSGRYKSHPPLIYKVEKRLGICRHLMLPNPSDALVLQTVVESISKEISSTSPTEKAFYSRDKHNLILPHQVREPGDYPLHWRSLWKKFQKEILGFANNYKYLVVTDLTNYFDNIGLRELRHIISSRIQAHEVILDFLFNLIEQLSWNPDYLPTSLKGLPTINLEAPRLLAHALLFELDEILNVKTKGSFVRWMDDINFGVNSVDSACEILGAMNDVLKSRGLALNLGKTTYYTVEEAKRHFMVDENKYLDTFLTLKKSSRELKREFKKHLKNQDLQNWPKVTKRFLTTAAKMKTIVLLDDAVRLFKRNPAIRGHIAYYIESVGYRKRTCEVILKILDEANVYDDVTLFHICRLVTNWRIPTSKLGEILSKTC
ncbi:RNA-directed DNA polymerase [Desulfatibacillum aliphaticivorans]|uniref:RNA-directed DNA polymerase n=1 Tax=Desulfatibacillum aliphaticivorans TaxID=218208 RepID=UPI000407FC85|nr:RNA-directed DNA polymerase [Desulfatibacillum aliphaticivorans]